MNFVPALPLEPSLPLALAIALGAGLGLVIGSFLATLVLRWPRGEKLAGRSRCDGCGTPIGAAGLIPLLSYLRQRGRCLRCGVAINAVHPGLELAAAAVGALALAAAPGPQGLAGALFGWILLALVVLDHRHFWLPDRLTMPLLGLGLLLGPGTFGDRALSAGVAGGGLLVVMLLYRLLRGREGLGLGDVKLMAALGAWLSIAHLPPLLLLASLLGLAHAGVEKWHHTRADTPEPGIGRGPQRVPFGACLALAAFPLWLYASAGS